MFDLKIEMRQQFVLLLINFNGGDILKSVINIFEVEIFIENSLRF